MKVYDLVRQIRDEAEDRDEYCLVVWCIDDVLGLAEQRGVNLSVDEAKEAIALISHNHDCELGISWVTLDCAIDEIISEREE